MELAQEAVRIYDHMRLIEGIRRLLHAELHEQTAKSWRRMGHRSGRETCYYQKIACHMHEGQQIQPDLPDEIRLQVPVTVNR